MSKEFCSSRARLVMVCESCWMRGRLSGGAVGSPSMERTGMSRHAVPVMKNSRGGSDEVCGEHVCVLDDVETEFLCGV